MKKHADIIRPKFQMVDDLLKEEIGTRGIGSWVNPKGGYFISFEALEGCAKTIVAKCKEAGVVLTGAGSPFPYKNICNGIITDFPVKRHIFQKNLQKN